MTTELEKRLSTSGYSDCSRVGWESNLPKELIRKWARSTSILQSISHQTRHPDGSFLLASFPRRSL